MRDTIGDTPDLVPARFVAWYTTATEAEAHAFDTATEANAWAMHMSNIDGWIAGGSFRVPARWTVKGALDNALLRAHRAQGATT